MKETLEIGAKKTIRKSKVKNDLSSNNGSSSKQMQQQEEDRLSSLPDSLLVQIVSLLPLHSAVATSVLSHRWRHLWTHHTRLDFNTLPFTLLNFSKFCKILSQLLPKLTSSNIHGFHLHYPYAQTSKQIDTWKSYFASLIPKICRRNPREIKVILQVPSTRYPLISLPLCALETPSLVTLELSGPFRCEFPRNGTIRLPNLKKLELNLLHVSPALMANFVKSSPLLECLSLELIWVEHELVMEISAPNLKSLNVTMSGYSEDCKFLIDAPKLEHVLLHGRFAFYHFVNNQSALIDADIGFCFSTMQNRNDYLSHLSTILQKFSSVKTIHLLDNIGALNSINYVDASVLRGFCNLTKLRITRVSLEYLNWDSPIPEFLLSKLEWMEFEELDGDEDDLELLKYVLSKAEVLKELSVYVTYSDDNESDDEECEKYQLWKELSFCKKLFMLSRSLTCEIKLFGEYISTSSKTFQNGSMLCRIDCFEKGETIYDNWYE